MSGSQLRARLKRLLPELLKKPARRALTYFRRLIAWRAVVKELKGATPTDQLIIRRSFRRGLISALRQLDQWQDPQLIADATVQSPGTGEFEIRAYSDDLYHVLPSREAAVVAEIRKRLAEGSTFIDAGANIGFFTVLAARIVGPGGRVFAIEMMPGTATRLRRHVSNNALSNVTIFEHALSDRSGERLMATVPEHKFGRASIVLDSRGEAFSNVEVHSRTLDELLADAAGTINLIKMDLEGAETMALRGAREVLSRTGAVIFEQLPGETSAAALLEEHGFQLKMLNGPNMLATRTQ